MKRALKIFLWVIVCFAVITLSQAATFAGVWELEKTFLTGFWNAPKDWIGTVVLWKYAAVGLSALGVIVTAAVSLTRKGLKKRKPKQRKEKRKEETRPPEPRKLNNVTDGGVVMSSTAKTSNPTKFTRVPPKE